MKLELTNDQKIKILKEMSESQIKEVISEPLVIPKKVFFSLFVRGYSAIRIKIEPHP